jgi:hypothetical protein
MTHSDKFSPESTKNTIDQFRRHSLDRAALAHRALQHGAIPLGVLLDILAGEVFRETGKEPTRETLERADLEYCEGFRTLLGNAKRAILEGKLTVRQLTTLAPVNGEPGIRAWCNRDDTLKNVDEMRPHERLIVKLEDARTWLGDMEVPVPEWLKAGHERQVEKTQAPESKMKRQERRVLEIITEIGLDPDEFPAEHKGRHSDPKTKVREIATRERNLFPSRDTFDSAWKRLMASAQIIRADEDKF